MTGGGLSRFANRNKPASGSTNLACVAAAVPPGNGAAAADAAARRASEGPDTTSMSYEARVAPFESYVGFENINYDFGGGMVDYGSPILQMNHGSMHVNPKAIQDKGSQPSASTAKEPMNNPPGVDSGFSTQEQAVPTAAVKETNQMTSGATHSSPASSLAPVGTSVCLLHDKVGGDSLSKSPGGCTTLKNCNGTATQSDLFFRCKLKRAPRSNILFTSRPKGQSMMRLVPDPASLTKVLPPAAIVARCSRTGQPGIEAFSESATSKEGMSLHSAGCTPTREGQGQMLTPHGSILKKSRFVGTPSDGKQAGQCPTAVLTPSPTGLPVGFSGSIDAPGIQNPGESEPAHPSPALADRSVCMTPSDRPALAVTPGPSGVTDKKTVRFDPKNLTETFLIPRVLPEPVPDAPAQGEEQELGMSLGTSDPSTNATIEGESGFSFDDAHQSFLSICRDSTDQIKVMSDEILDLNVYLDSLQAELLVMQAKMMDLSEDADGLCNKYDDLLGFLSDNFPDTE